MLSEECKYEIKKYKMKNLINSDLDLDSSDDEPGKKSGGESTDESGDESGDKNNVLRLNNESINQ